MKRIVVTGANRGIGLELCRQLSGRGDHVIAVCRAPSGPLEALGIEVIEDIDVADPESIQRLKTRLVDVALDGLINNAGILKRSSLEEPDYEMMQRQFEVNALGPLRVTAALRDNLKRGSRVVIITSRMGSIADNTSGGSYGYRMSKAAVNMAGRSLALDLKEDGIAVGLLHPGFVRTDMTRGNGLIDADESASGLLERFDALTLNNTGSFWHAQGQVLPW